MGFPKMQKKKYNKPKKPFDKNRIEAEKKILKKYGLKRKHEIWRAESLIRNFRRRAREIQASEDKKAEKLLMKKLNSMNINCSNLDDVLSLDSETILSRRLQTVVYNKGYANSVLQARQNITHGKVLVNNRKLKYPGYIVKKKDTIKVIGNIKEVSE